MNLVTIAEHTVDMDLLPPKASILDAGCLGFTFYDEMKRLGHKVLAIDIQEFERTDYARLALAGKDGAVGINRTSDPQAASIMVGDEVPAMSIETLSDIADTPFWDLIKFDIEGAEYEVIMSLTKAPTTQISVEMHLHTRTYSQNEVVLMVAKLHSLGYKTVQHKLEARHGAGFNYWDSLFVLE